MKRQLTTRRALRLLAPLLLLLAALPARGDENDACFKCHDDDELTAERKGKEVSAYVDPEAYRNSVHGTQECINCHADLDGASLPHADDLEPVNCGDCHDRQAKEHMRSLHGQALAKGDEMAPFCSDCHGTHDILSHGDPASPTAIENIPALCGQCHREGSPVSRTHDIPQDRIFENYSMSMHARGLFEAGLTVVAVCTSCHTSHNILPHTDPESSINRARVARTCMQCHGRIERVHRKVIEGRLWEEEPGKIPACVDCHPPHKIRRVLYEESVYNTTCLASDCHGNPELTVVREGKALSLYVDEYAYSGSAHADRTCAQCHIEVKESPTRACETIVNRVDCSICHAEVVDGYNTGIHGRLHAEGDPDAPVCLDCHDRHATTTKRNPISPTFPRNIPVLCGRCHREGEKAAVRIESEIPDIVASYRMSIHGKGLLKSGLTVTATCTNCHTAHHELPPSDPDSSVHPDHVADTCGSCHHGIEETFKTSIHWPENNPDARDRLPTCESCHTSHSISRTDQANFRLLMMDQCGNCHTKEATTFFDTYHGKVSRLGSPGAAKCYDCHGTHGILPPSDPNSTLSRRNVVETCAQCHTGAHRAFTGYLTHATHHDPETYPWLFWTFWGMTSLLVGTLAFALLHTAAWLVRLWLSRDEWRAHHAAMAGGDTRLFRRFNRYQRTLHIFMILSFFTLALTGMTLKFSYMSWAQGLGRVLGGFDTMGVLHRMGAITLFTIFVLHLLDVRKKKKASGRSWIQMILGPDSIIFNPTDFREAWQSIRWFFGRGPRPRFGRYTYWEKFDYFAVFWGVFIIGLSGLILWFPEIATRVIPGWFVNVATIIHSDEALLAVGFIFTVHFFNTHFRPDKWPMDPVIFTGRMTVEELKFDKPREYERLLETGELENHIVAPFPEPAERGFRIFGFVALFVGLSLIAAIVYTFLVGYPLG